MSNLCPIYLFMFFCLSCLSTVPGQKMGKYLEITFVFQPLNVSLESWFILFFNTVTIYHFCSALVGMNHRTIES